MTDSFRRIDVICKASWVRRRGEPHAATAGLPPGAVGLRGYQQLRRFARRWPGASWTIDCAGGPALFLARLAAEGPDAVDVPAKLATWFAFHRHGRKNDTADAVAVAGTSLTASRLQSCAFACLR
jgi:transposase